MSALPAETERRGLEAAERLARRIEDEDAARLREMTRVMPVHRNRASSIGDPCERRLYLWRTAWDRAAPVGEDLQSIFGEGNLHEVDVVRRLAQRGIRLRHEQVAFEYAGVTGHIDGDAVDGESGEAVLLEIKSCSANVWPRLRTAADLRDARGGSAYVAKWYSQIQVYLVGSSPAYASAVALLKNKGTGRLRAIPIPIDYEHAEAMLQRARRVDEAVASGVPPPFIEDAEECQRCAFFGRACNPPVESGEGAEIVTADHLIEAARAWRETEEAARRHRDADEELKGALRGRELALVGGLLVQTKTRVVKRKAQEAKEVEQQVVTIRALEPAS